MIDDRRKGLVLGENFKRKRGNIFEVWKNKNQDQSSYRYIPNSCFAREWDFFIWKLGKFEEVVVGITTPLGFFWPSPH